MKNQSLSIIAGLDRPGCNVPIECMDTLTLHKSVSNHHLPDFFFITNIGEFQGV